jgi:hypothetical protein
MPFWEHLFWGTRIPVLSPGHHSPLGLDKLLVLVLGVWYDNI